MTRRKRPRFNGSGDDHAATELLASIRPAPEDGATWHTGPAPVQFTGGSDLGVMPGGVMVIEVAGPAPLASYRPAPASFPALPPAPEPLPEWERDLLAEQAREMARPVLAAVPVTEPAVIGDALRLPFVWCGMPRCINYHRDPGSLGERDARDRATADGWRYDALGRFACPPCQQTRADYRTPLPVTWHHPEVARRWHARQPLSDTGAFRLSVEAELGRRISYEDPALARAIAGATYRAKHAEAKQ